MAKHWNRKHGSYLQSYHIEALALDIFTSTMDDITWDVHIFFDKAYELISSYLWYEGAHVDDYLIWDKRQEAKKRLETAKNKSLTAWHKTYNDNDDDEGAITIWRQIFGNEYPAYG